jgi:hypothetical protein
MNKKITIILMNAVISILFLSSSAPALMRGLSTQELTNASEIVVIGEIKDVESFWSRDYRTIYTSASVVVHDVVTGNLAGTVITVEYEGGEVGGIGLNVSDMSSLSENEEVLLFLKAGQGDRGNKVYRIVGKSQGKYTIHEDGTVEKKGFTLLDGEERIDNNLPVDLLIDKIRKARQ